MALTAPFDILSNWPGWTLTFDLLWRQEQSRQTNGVTRLKDFGAPLWQTSVTSKALTRPQLDYWRARLNRLRNGEETFFGYSLSRCWPMAYPGGTWPTGGAFDGTASLASVGGDNKSIAVSGLPAGFKFSVGDFLQIGTNDLYEVQEVATADGTGTTGSLEVLPNIWPGTTTGSPVSVKRPYCLMTLVPGSLATPAEDNGLGKITFNAVESR